MIYLFQAVLLVFVLACAMMGEVFGLWSILRSEGNWTHSFCKSIAAGSGLVIYAALDYSMLDYLMLVPGTIYVIA